MYSLRLVGTRVMLKSLMAGLMVESEELQVNEERELEQDEHDCVSKLE